LMFTFGERPAGERPAGDAGCTEEVAKPWSCWSNVMSAAQLAEPSTSTQSAWSLGGSDESPGTWSAGFGSNASPDVNANAPAEAAGSPAQAADSPECDRSQESRRTLVTVQTVMSLRGLESPPPANSIFRRIASPASGGDLGDRGSQRDLCREVLRDPPTPSTPFFGSEAAKATQLTATAQSAERLAGAGSQEAEQDRKTQLALADALEQLRRNTSLLRLTNEEILFGPFGPVLAKV